MWTAARHFQPLRSIRKLIDSLPYAKINVLQQVNASRGDIAYNVIVLAKPEDTDSLEFKSWEAMQEALTNVDAVISTRLILGDDASKGNYYAKKLGGALSRARAFLGVPSRRRRLALWCVATLHQHIRITACVLDPPTAPFRRDHRCHHAVDVAEPRATFPASRTLFPALLRLHLGAGKIV